MKKMTPLEEIRHSSSHVLATAVLRHFPTARLDIGPPTDKGFYYDFDLDHAFTPQDLELLEKEMRKIIREDQVFTRREVSRDEAANLFQSKGQSYKIERLADIPEDEAVSLYQNGEFIDLCAGTHVERTSQIGAVKLLSIAGAYYRGDEKNKQLQRIYGTAFPDQASLDAYLEKLEQAKQRDHRKLGRELQLFHIDEKVGGGLVLWTPAGAVIRQELQNFIMAELTRQGYQQVFTPHIGKLDLFRTSGHFPYYQDSQYPALVDREVLQGMATEGASCGDLSSRLESGDIDGHLLKPMNCPFHIAIFKSQPHSYRDLPVRLAEFGTVYRWEQSGELNGLTRVRGFTQDDAHLFCREDQLEEELGKCLQLVNTVFTTLGLSNYRVRLSFSDPASDKYIGDRAAWDKAENALRQAAAQLDVPSSVELGEAAFYGPKIDFLVKDVLDREWQLGTVQLDYNLPERFDLTYAGSDNKPHRPVMIHRAPFGSLERFTGVLIEHFGGNFPTWLAPEQVRILPISEKVSEFADKVLAEFRQAGLRAELDSSDEKLGAKIRKGETRKVPYLVVVGPREAEQGQISLRSRVNKSLEGVHLLADAVAAIRDEVKERRLPST
jgi:threonyl-tRNA synthetase